MKINSKILFTRVDPVFPSILHLQQGKVSLARLSNVQCPLREPVALSGPSRYGERNKTEGIYCTDLQNIFTFTKSASLCPFSHRVAMSLCLSGCLCHWVQFFLGLSFALRSHDQFQASSSSFLPLPPQK